MASSRNGSKGLSLVGEVLYRQLEVAFGLYDRDTQYKIQGS